MSDSMNQRRRKLALTSTAGLAMTALIVILLNVTANWVFTRWDMTSSKVYSLSPASKLLMKKLDDRFVIKAYFTPDLPPPQNIYERYVRDLLTEYRSASHGRLQFQFMPTNPTATFEQDATAAGLAPVQFEQMGSDQLAIRRGFMGLTLFYGDKTDTIPVVKNIQTLEYDLTSRIARMTVKTKKSILLSTGHGEVRWRDNPNSKLAQDVSQLYALHEVAFSSAAVPAPLSGDALFVVGPRTKFDTKSLWLIDQAIMRGIPTAFLVDAKDVMVTRFMAGPLDVGLNDLLKHYGVDLGSQLVFDPQSATVGLTQNYGGMAVTQSIRYDYIPLITQFNATSPLVRGLSTVALPFVVTTDAVSPLPPGVTFTPLFKTSEKSALAPATTYNVSPMNMPAALPDELHGPYVVGGVLEGKFTSYFHGKPQVFAGIDTIDSSPATQIVVLGTSHVLDPSMPEFPGMEALLTNLMASLSHDETLIGIQAKGDLLRPLKPISAGARELVKLFCVLGVPCLPVLFGLVRWRRRGQWREKVVSQYAPVAAPPTLPPAALP